MHADLSSIAFAIAGLIAAWAVLRSRLLDLVPVAWPTLVDSLADAVLVLDPERRIAACNPSATRLLGTGGDAVGQAIAQVLHRFPDLVAVCQEAGEREDEIPLGPRAIRVTGTRVSGSRIAVTATAGPLVQRPGQRDRGREAP